MENEQRFNTLEHKVDNLQGDVCALQSDVQTLQTDVKVLQTDVKALQTDVKVLQTDVKALQTDVKVLQTDVKVLQTDVKVLQTDVGDLIEAVHHYAEKTDKRFDRIEAAMVTKADVREIVQDAFDRSWDRALAKIKQVDVHVDAVVDTLADDGTITPLSRTKLHAMPPFPKLAQDA